VETVLSGVSQQEISTSVAGQEDFKVTVVSFVSGAEVGAVSIVNIVASNSRRLTATEWHQDYLQQASMRAVAKRGPVTYEVASTTVGWTISLNMVSFGYSSAGKLYRSVTGALSEATDSGSFASSLAGADQGIFANVSVAQTYLGYKIITPSPTLAPVKFLDNDKLMNGVIPCVKYGGIAAGGVLVIGLIGWLFYKYKTKPQLQKRRQHRIVVPVRSFEPVNLDTVEAPRFKQEDEDIGGMMYDGFDFTDQFYPRSSHVHQFRYEEERHDDTKLDDPVPLFVRRREFPV
jgi:hypothetical protein